MSFIAVYLTTPPDLQSKEVNIDADYARKMLTDIVKGAGSVEVHP
jgi:hypothetical protein